MIQESMMKWRVRRDSRCNSIENEDIRRSIEILDNVLAEYDETGDCCFIPNGDAWRDEMENCNSGEVLLRRRSVADLDCSSSSLSSSSARSSFESYRPVSIDGSTNQLFQSSPSEKWRKFSPPPVPKRSPGTRLSYKGTQFRFPETSCSDNEIDNPLLPSIGNDAKHKKQKSASRVSSPGYNFDDKANENITAATNHALEKAAITHSNDLSLGWRDDIITQDDVFVNIGISPRSDLCGECSRCGGRASLSPRVMAADIRRTPSVAMRREEFEKYSRFGAKDKKERKFLSSDSGIDSSIVTNSPFLKKVPSETNCEKLILSPSCLKDMKKKNKCCSESNISQIPNPSDGTSQKRMLKDKIANPDDSKQVQVVESQTHPDAFQVERIAKLNVRFAMVKLLLKSNKILLLQTEPPSFIPPLPPIPPCGNDSEVDHDIEVTSNEDLVEESQNKYPSDEATAAFLCAKCQVFEEKRRKMADDSKCNKEASQKDDSTGDSKESSRVDAVTDSIADLPKLLPTYTLTRPQFGFDCAMEDDFCPGAKDILTSTPKSDKIHLSTFSQSVSSLGYVSSQSDQDLNSTFGDCDKVPIVSLKSQTLPTGIRMVPPLSYPADLTDECNNDYSYEPEKSLDLSKPPKTDHFRSSSAPPLKHLQPPERKGLFGMSRKERKPKSKNDDDLSMKSNSSAEDGVFLKKMSTLDGSTEIKKIKNYIEADPATEDKMKRKSVWKSILRRK